MFSRDGGGHVGFAVGKDTAGRLLVLGGNQGNAVSIAAFDVARAIGYRWPAGVPRMPCAMPRVRRNGLHACGRTTAPACRRPA